MGVYNIYAPTEATVTHYRSGLYCITLGPVCTLYRGPVCWSGPWVQSINYTLPKSVIIKDVLCREGWESQSSSTSMEKLSTLIDQGVDETVQAASSSRKKLPQCLSMNYHGHHHGDKRNQQ